MGKKVGVTCEDREKAKPYEQALRLAGLEPVLISANEPWSLKGLDGLLLTGGPDVNPRLYGQDPHPQTRTSPGARDRMEIGLLGEALDRDLPVLAICRGMQLFSVYHRGTLVQHIGNGAHVVRSPDLSLPVHDVQVAPHTKLAEILGAGSHPVNSRHHQAVEKPGEGLTVSARAKGDGIIEALERPDKRFAVAVQWHPEDQVAHDETQRRLFQAFADAM